MIREQNPLNNINVPQGGVNNVDARIEQFYIPVDHETDQVHPLMHKSTYD